MNVEGKRVLITGGSSGIGLATAQALVRKGAKIAITGRRQDLLTAAIGRLGAEGGSVDSIAADLATRQGRETTLTRAIEILGGLDVLINNAGGVRAALLAATFFALRAITSISGNTSRRAVCMASYASLRVMSVLATQHQRQHPGRLPGIARVFRSKLATLVVVVELPEEFPVYELEATEVVLPVGIVVSAEGAERCDLAECGSLHHVGKLGDAARHHYPAAGECPPEGVIEITNAGGAINGIFCHASLLDEAGEHQAAHHPISTAGFAVSLSLVPLQVGGCPALHADCGAKTVAHRDLDQIVDRFEPRGFAQLDEPHGLMCKSNFGHVTPPRYRQPIIRLPVREAENWSILSTLEHLSPVASVPLPTSVGCRRTGPRVSSGIVAERPLGP
jgi:hypothetical protein